MEVNENSECGIRHLRASREEVEKNAQDTYLLTDTHDNINQH
jgi:hypothetical protein